jgi:2-polyprenyl-3-methyl-5-hydroxy-6-metoxy-1,4-benzoquinol methylase
VRRIPELELMDREDQAVSYAQADFSASNKIFLNNLFEQTSITNKTKILDIGCGDGEIPIILFEQTKCQLTAIDGSENMLKQFILKKEKHNIKDIQIYKKLINSNLFPDTVFDLVINNSVLHHVSDVFMFWENAIRLIGPKGTIILMDLVRPKTNLDLQKKLIKYGGSDPILLSDFENSLRAAYTIDEVTAQLKTFNEITFTIKSVSDRHFFATINNK